MLLKINGKDYYVNDNEFEIQPHNLYTYLSIRKNVGVYERLISLINELNCLERQNLILYKNTHGGFIPIHCSQNYKNIYAIETEINHIDNFLCNIEKHKINNITIKKYNPNCIVVFAILFII
jgi:hypothetical protein